MKKKKKNLQAIKANATNYIPIERKKETNFLNSKRNYNFNKGAKRKIK